MLAFKALLAGDTAAASVLGKSLVSGAYTFWKDAGANVGFETTTVTASTAAACLASCDSDAACAAVKMTGVTAIGDTVASCNMIKGDPAIATWKRSATKAVATKLTLAAAL